MAKLKNVNAQTLERVLDALTEQKVIKIKNFSVFISFQCEKCSKTFATDAALQQHISADHPVVTQPPTTVVTPKVTLTTLPAQQPVTTSPSPLVPQSPIESPPVKQSPVVTRQNSVPQFHTEIPSVKQSPVVTRQNSAPITPAKATPEKPTGPQRFVFPGRKTSVESISALKQTESVNKRSNTFESITPIKKQAIVEPVTIIEEEEPKIDLSDIVVMEPVKLTDRYGSIHILNYGRIVYVTPKFRIEEHTYPLGYKSERQWQSMRFAKVPTWYVCEVLSGKGNPDTDPAAAPKFRYSCTMCRKFIEKSYSQR